MKKKPGFALRSVCGENFLIAEGMQNIDFSKLIALNESSTYLWKAIKQDEYFTAESMADLLMQEYEVDRETAIKDAQQLINSLVEAGVIE